MDRFSAAKDVLPMSELRARLTEKIDDLSKGSGCILVTRNGRTAAVILSPEEYDRLRYEGYVRRKIAKGLEDAAAGRTIPHSRVMRAARKLLDGAPDDAD